MGFLYFFLLLFNLSENEEFDYDDLKKSYIRNCYYRLITEILVCSGHETARAKNLVKFSRPFVVVGNPGIGKSSLSYLFIRALMEMGVEVLLVVFYYCIF
jgi:DNA replication protein DnaC